MKPVRMWAVVDEAGRVMVVDWTERRARKSMTEGFYSAPENKWPYWRDKGFTVQRVLVTIEEKEKE